MAASADGNELVALKVPAWILCSLLADRFAQTL